MGGPRSGSGYAGEATPEREGGVRADGRSYRGALTRLGAVQKPGAGAPPYSRWVNRRLGRWLAAAAYVLDRTPNQVTVASALCTLTGLLLVAVVPPGWWLGPVVCALLVLGYALDAADGQLARLRGGGSPAGEWLDHMVDALKMSLVHTVVLVGIFRFEDARGLRLLLPLAFQVVASVFFFGFILTDQLRGARQAAGHRRNRPTPGAVQTLAAVPTDYGLLCLVFAFWGWGTGFLTLYGALLAGSATVVTVAVARWWTEVSSWGSGD